MQKYKENYGRSIKTGNESSANMSYVCMIKVIAQIINFYLAWYNSVRVSEVFRLQNCFVQVVSALGFAVILHRCDTFVQLMFLS